MSWFVVACLQSRGFAFVRLADGARGWQSGGFRDAFGFDVVTLKGRHMRKERLR